MNVYQVKYATIEYYNMSVLNKKHCISLYATTIYIYNVSFD